MSNELTDRIDAVADDLASMNAQLSGTVEVPLSQLGQIQDQLIFISAQLGELMQFKREAEAALLEMQSGGMMKMFGKLFG